jgi:DNA polymerase-3 subunit alpha
MDFVNLHSHSTYSLLDGCADIESMVSKAVDLEMPAIALTDHGTLSGALSFYLECNKQGVKPIIGVEMYVDDSDERKGEYRHVILLAKNLKGYKNLLKIVSEAHVNGFYYRPRTTSEKIFKNKEGLIVSTACMGGILGKLYSKDNSKALKEAKKWKHHFGKDFYIEIQINEMEIQKFVNSWLIDIANKLKIKAIITLDSHYVEPEDVKIQDFILAVRSQKTIDDKKKFAYTARKLYLMTPSEIWKRIKQWGHDIRLKDFKKYMANTVEIADKCSIKIPLGKFHIPQMGFTPGEFRSLVKNRATKLDLMEKKKYRNRLKYELQVIEKLNFQDYFLMVEDLVRWCKKKGIFVGAARGSVAGSLVSYTLGITKINPLDYGLLFERFLNESRPDMPDIDLDFDANKRERVFEYIKKKYGGNKVARVIVFGTFGKAGSIRDIGRVFKLPIKPINEIVDAIYKQDGIKEAYKNLSGSLRVFWKEHKELIKLGIKVSPLIRHASVHPCGTIVSPKPVYTYCPLQRVKGEIVSGYSEGIKGRELSEIGLVKLDILGLNTCSIISDTLDIIKESTGKKLGKKIWRLNTKDKKLLKEARLGNTSGAFQFETESATQLLRKVKPKTFEEIAALNAINRPGPLGSGAVERFYTEEGMGIDNDTIVEILDETRGVLVYQEQVTKILNQVAGYPLVEAETIRKMAAKKIFETDKNLRVKFKKEFLKRCTKELDREDAKDLWKIIGEFTKYSFNKSHAVSYTYLFFQVLWLKNNYPGPFFTSLLTNTSSTVIKQRKKGTELNKLYGYINEARRYGLKILGPNINKSGLGFTLHKKDILFGLAKIKGIKEPSVEEILEKRPFSTFSDFVNRISNKIHKGKIVSLIQAGAFDCLDDRQSIKRQFNSIRKDQIFNLKESITQDSIDAFGFILLHPFYEDKVKEYLIKKYCTPSQQLQKFNRWERVGIAGIIVSITTPMSGKSTKVLKIQDHRGDMFIYLDREADKRYSGILEKMNIVFVNGRLMGSNRILCNGSKDKIFNITEKIGKLSESTSCRNRRNLI